jgi:hypothetical protein
MAGFGDCQPERRSIMASMLHRLSLFLEFPEGLRPGAGKSGGNQLQIDLDGHDRPVFAWKRCRRGLAACICRHIGMPLKHRKFPHGSAPVAMPNEGRKSGNPSPLRVQDMVFSANSSQRSNCFAPSQRHWTGTGAPFAPTDSTIFFALAPEWKLQPLWVRIRRI